VDWCGHADGQGERMERLQLEDAQKTVTRKDQAEKSIDEQHCHLFASNVFFEVLTSSLELSITKTFSFYCKVIAMNITSDYIHCFSFTRVMCIVSSQFLFHCLIVMLTDPYTLSSTQ